jgi:hypothetical protein
VVSDVQRTKVLVVWHDAHSLSNDWCELSDIDNEPCVVETIGWLLSNTKSDHVVVAQSITGDDSLDSILCIPVGMVQSVQVL